jgi:hypothetical protein
MPRLFFDLGKQIAKPDHEAAGEAFRQVTTGMLSGRCAHIGLPGRRDMQPRHIL